MALNLRYRWPQKNSSGQKYFYSIIEKCGILRHTDDYNDIKKITADGESLDMSHLNGIVISSCWTNFIHEIMYVDHDTDTWYNLVYHFMYCDGFEGMYINNKKDVIIEMNITYSTKIYYILQYMKWTITYYDICNNTTIYIDSINLSNSGFYQIITPKSKIAIGYNRCIINAVLDGFRKVVSKDNYKTKKMVTDIIEGKTISINKRLYDVSVVCCL